MNKVAIGVCLAMMAFWASACSSTEPAAPATVPTVIFDEPSIPSADFPDTSSDSGFDAGDGNSAGVAAMAIFGEESVLSWDSASQQQFCSDGSNGIMALGNLLHQRFPEYSSSDARTAARLVASSVC